MSQQHETDKPLRGWLVNPARRERRDRSNTFTDQDAIKLIRKIEAFPEYISPILQPEKLDLLMRLRDKSMIALNWIWFKRGNEVLRLKRKDIAVTDRELLVTFEIQKKKKRFKICPVCDEKNGYRNKFCRSCSLDLKSLQITEEGETKIVTKRKTLQHKFTKYIIDWLREFDKQTADKEAWFFPSLRVCFTSAYFDFFSEKPMTIQNWDRILKRLDPRMTSCLFRYGGVEKYLNLGYSEREMRQIGDWESSRMPEIYAERKGITPAQRRFAEDIR